MNSLARADSKSTTCARELRLMATAVLRTQPMNPPPDPLMSPPRERRKPQSDPAALSSCNPHDSPPPHDDGALPPALRTPPALQPDQRIPAPRARVRTPQASFHEPRDDAPPSASQPRQHEQPRPGIQQRVADHPDRVRSHGEATIERVGVLSTERSQDSRQTRLADAHRAASSLEARLRSRIGARQTPEGEAVRPDDAELGIRRTIRNERAPTRRAACSGTRGRSNTPTSDVPIRAPANA